VSRVLVVANETVEADELLTELRRIEDEKTSTFLVVAPAVPVEHGLGTWSQEGAITAANERLGATLDILRREGLDADGHVGDMLPIPAIEDALLRFDADLIVISTHPPERSRWIRKDIVGKTRRKFGRPVRHVISHVPETEVAT
jgi:GABA permease